LLMLVMNSPSGAMSIADDEDANDALGTAGIQILRGTDPSAHVGIFSLTPGDVDFLGLGPLDAGDIITAVTTPLEGGLFEVPDTMLGVFRADGDRLIFNNDAGEVGLGSLIHFLVPSAGDYFLAVTGRGDDDFDGFHDQFEQPHGEDGRYLFTVGLVPIPEPSTLPLLIAGIAGLAALPRIRRR